MNRGAIRDLIRKRLGETTASFWSTAELNGWINNACSDVAFRAKCLKTNGYFTTTSCTSNTVSANSSEITLSSTFSDIYAVLEVYFHTEGERWERLDPATRNVLDIEYPGWRDAVGRTYTNTSSGVTTYNYQSNTGIPFTYYWDREEDYFGVYPPCDSDNATSNNVRVYYSQIHSDLSDDTDTPTIPQPLHFAIVDHVVATGYETRGWGDKANDAWTKYFDKIKDYQVERHREREDEEIIMRNYRNI